MRVSAPVRAAAQRLVLPLLILASIALIILGKADIVLFDRSRAALADATAPLFSLIAQPAATVAGGVKHVEEMVNVFSENAQLRQENARLLQWQEVARRLQADNAELRSLNRWVPESAGSFVAARVVADSGGAFVRNVLVDAGSRDGVARGQAATTGEGLVGRVSEVGERTARILLLTDLNSHVPVVLEGSHQRAMLDGDNSDQPLLVYVPPKTEVKVGDRILTSGSGGVFPPDLPVGEVASVDGGVVRVDPFAPLGRLQVLRIVDFGLSGVLPQSVLPPPRPAKAVKAGGADSGP